MCAEVEEREHLISGGIGAQPAQRRGGRLRVRQELPLAAAAHCRRRRCCHRCTGAAVIRDVVSGAGSAAERRPLANRRRKLPRKWLRSVTMTAPLPLLRSSALRQQRCLKRLRCSARKVEFAGCGTRRYSLAEDMLLGSTDALRFVSPLDML